ncbi:membrane protein [Streptomyces phage Dryad]|nr:membrane protein [Streptomyces phage Dryad]
MGLKERIVQTVLNNLMLALSGTAGGLLALKVTPWLISSGLLRVTMVMK